MTPITVLAIGQSNMRGGLGATGGEKDFPTAAKFFNSKERSFGTAWVDPVWGQFPFDRTEDGGLSYSNNISLSFARTVIQATGRPVWTYFVAKGQQPIESFLRPATRLKGEWPLPDGKANLAPLLYNPTHGARAALDLVPAPHFDVVLMHQGEANARNSGQSYAEKIKALYADLSDTALIRPTTQFLIGGLWEGKPFYAVHKNALIAAAQELPNFHFIDSNGLINMADGRHSPLHFPGLELQEIGRRMAAAYLQ